MGAWGSGPFDNDSAHDWLVDLGDLDPESALLGAFEAIPEVEYLEVDEGSAVVAAAAVLLAALRKDASALPEGAARLASGLTPTEELREMAVAALDRVAGEGSELAELWAEGGPEEWIAEIAAMREALERG